MRDRLYADLNFWSSSSDLRPSIVEVVVDSCCPKFPRSRMFSPIVSFHTYSGISLPSSTMETLRQQMAQRRVALAGLQTAASWGGGISAKYLEDHDELYVYIYIYICGQARIFFG